MTGISSSLPSGPLRRLALLALCACAAGPTAGEPCGEEDLAVCGPDETPLLVCASALGGPGGTQRVWRSFDRLGLGYEGCRCRVDPSSGATKWECITTFRDQGRICVTPGSEWSSGGALEAGSPVTVHVAFPVCLSSSCDVDRQTSCSVSQSGSTLQVSAMGSYRHRGTLCTLDCGFLLARCTTGPLAAGDYTVTMGTERATVTIPSTKPTPPCGRFP